MDRLTKRTIRVTPAVFLICLGTMLYAPVFSQAHTAVSLDSRIYYILEQAELKGLCAPLSGIKPYSRTTVVSAIKEILNTEKTGGLKDTERDILEQYLEQLDTPQPGLNWGRGVYHGETSLGKLDFPLSLNVGAGADMAISGSSFPSLAERYTGTEIWVQVYANGDIGRNASWEFGAEGGLMRNPRRLLGTYNTYYEGFEDHGEFQNRILPVYSESLTYFPYTYRKRWDGSVFPLATLSDFVEWPGSPAGGYNLKSELALSFLENKLALRLGRLPREWGTVSFGSSLALNQAARPFLALEAEFRPFSWFGIASLTGVLEYFNTEGIKISSMFNQNAFSATLLQFRFKNYLFLDIGETVVWPKRFELGYPSIITNSIFYQNNIGDFDNMAMVLNIKGQYPGIGNVWFSLFWDEAYIVRNFYELDRTMLVLQAGINVPLPFLSFSSVKLSYTMVNPYSYGHNRNYNPWYGDLSMETSYTNNGVSLGYYLPPNSDEILIRFKTMPVKSLQTHLQYQMIRHGANYGSSSVDGSSLLSELDPENRDGSNPALKRYFLKDGAYQWMHIVKAGAEWNVPGLPVSLYGEAGIHYSYFTDITAGKANTGDAYPYSVINTSEYPKSTGFIFNLGFRLFPRY